MAKPVPAATRPCWNWPAPKGTKFTRKLRRSTVRTVTWRDICSICRRCSSASRASAARSSAARLRGRLLGPALGADAVQLGGQRLALLLHEGHRRGRIDERVEREVRVDAEQRGDVPLGLLGALEVEGGEPGELVPLDQRRLVHRAAVDAALGALQHLAVVAELELRLDGREVAGLPGVWPLLGERRRDREEAEGEQAPPAHSGTSLPARVRVAPGITSTVARTLR